MQLYMRHGDIVIEELDDITGELTPAKDLVLAGRDHPHVVRGRVMMRRDGRRTFYVVPEPTTIDHGKPDGHRDRPHKAGKFEARPLRERGDMADRAVAD